MRDGLRVAAHCRAHAISGCGELTVIGTFKLLLVRDRPAFSAHPQQLIQGIQRFRPSLVSDLLAAVCFAPTRVAAVRFAFASHDQHAGFIRDALQRVWRVSRNEEAHARGQRQLLHVATGDDTKLRGAAHHIDPCLASLHMIERHRDRPCAQLQFKLTSGLVDESLLAGFGVLVDP